MTEIYRGLVSQTKYFELVDSTTGLPKTGIAHGVVTASYVRTRSARVAITLSALGSAAAAFSSGGWYEVDATNQAGIYRLDIPDSAFVDGAGVDEVIVTIKATGCRTQSRGFTLIGVHGGVMGGEDALADTASADPGAYDGLLMLMTSGPNYGHVRRVTQYDGGAGKGFVPNPEWPSSEPGQGESYVLLPALTGSLTSGFETVATNAAGNPLATASAVTALPAAVWAVATSTLTVAGTIGKRILDFFGAGNYAAAPTAAANAAAVWDEALAGHATAGTAGKKLSDISSGSGSGAYAVTVTVTASGNAVAGATVAMTDGVLVYDAVTNALGVASFSLNASTYVLTVWKAGYLHTPQSVTIAAAGNTAAAITAITVTPASDPAQTTVYVTAYDTAGAKAAGVGITLKLLELPGGAAGLSLSTAERTETTAAVTGIAQFQGAWRNGRYRAFRGNSFVDFTAADAATSPVRLLLGQDA